MQVEVQTENQTIAIGDLISKLQQPWSLVNFTRYIRKDTLEGVTTRFTQLDPVLRARILLSILYLSQDKIEDFRPQLSALAQRGQEDNDEWVRYFAFAIQPFDGRLHMDHVIQNSDTVKENMERIHKHMISEGCKEGYRPLEEIYLNEDVLKQRGFEYPQVQQHKHFKVRPKEERKLKPETQIIQQNQGARYFQDVSQESHQGSQKKTNINITGTKGPSITPSKIEVFTKKDTQDSTRHPQQNNTTHHTVTQSQEQALKQKDKQSQPQPLLKTSPQDIPQEVLKSNSQEAQVYKDEAKEEQINPTEPLNQEGIPSSVPDQQNDEEEGEIVD